MITLVIICKIPLNVHISQRLLSNSELFFIFTTLVLQRKELDLHNWIAWTRPGLSNFCCCLDFGVWVNFVDLVWSSKGRKSVVTDFFSHFIPFQLLCMLISSVCFANTY